MSGSFSSDQCRMTLPDLKCDYTTDMTQMVIHQQVTAARLGATWVPIHFPDDLENVKGAATLHFLDPVIPPTIAEVMRLVKNMRVSGVEDITLTGAILAQIDQDRIDPTLSATHEVNDEDEDLGQLSWENEVVEVFGGKAEFEALKVYRNELREDLALFEELVTELSTGIAPDESVLNRLAKAHNTVDTIKAEIRKTFYSQIVFFDKNLQFIFSDTSTVESLPNASCRDWEIQIWEEIANQTKLAFSLSGDTSEEDRSQKLRFWIWSYQEPYSALIIFYDRAHLDDELRSLILTHERVDIYWEDDENERTTDWAAVLGAVGRGEYIVQAGSFGIAGLEDSD
ncbi:hypothetical protein BDN72DRAFT_865900 [Pluteus cervinus]|uniref:Uncharacterized protein n=1 Tax=Pluteus cervinus TaxID=181527 RepID=A0ACD2ZYK3_9AGAR|nr:hypothetical protein BDN72DRAFT_865900 [Pluteus cervinus]